MSDDIFVDDIFDNEGKPPRKNSGRKGKRGERGLCQLLSDRFKGQVFSRVIGSGAHGWRTMSESTKKVLTGDIVAPDNFKFTIECKHGYVEIELCGALDNGNKKIDAFLYQANKDADRLGRRPLVCWKKDRQPWLVFIRKEDLPLSDTTIRAKVWDYYITYGDWYALSLTSLLRMPDDFFFES